jgi:hypothetical protein
MRDAYAMRLHSVPSRFSNPALPAPLRKDVFGALFLYKAVALFHISGMVAPIFKFNYH